MNIKEMIESKRVLLSDGAWGTQMADRGMQPGECPELLNADRPEIVKAIAEAYIRAGSDIIITNTFGGSPYKLAKFALDSRCEELNEKGTAISREAAGTEGVVCASLGPAGEFLSPLGTVTEQEMTDAFSRQVRGFVKGGADCIVIETMSDIGEALCAFTAARECSALPVVVSMTFEKGQKGYATMMGITPETAAERLEQAGVDIIGSNCGAGIDQMLDIAKGMRSASDKPLWFKPNAGLPVLENGKTVFKETPEYMASRVPALVEAGAAIVGGCCGTTPAHIEAVRRILDSL